LAKINKVKIGAHPSFPDKENFGRQYVEMPPEELQNNLELQINLLKDRAKKQNVTLHHVKAHGALYNASAIEEPMAKTLVLAIKNTVENVFLYVPYNSVIARVAKQNAISIKYEAFIDRNYNTDLTLVSRQQSNALITSPEGAFNHFYNMLKKDKVLTVLGDEVGIKGDTYCIHGDNKNAVSILKYIKKQLINKGISIA